MLSTFKMICIYILPEYFRDIDTWYSFNCNIIRKAIKLIYLPSSVGGFPMRTKHFLKCNAHAALDVM
jgi:hypothetical protein